MKFLDFRLQVGGLEEKETEHDRYNKELDTIVKHYDEMSEVGKKLLMWRRDFTASILIIFHDVPHQLPCRLLACIGKGCLLVDDCTVPCLTD